MPEAVVDHLEAIEIHVEDREAVAHRAALVLVEALAERLEEIAAAAQAGERIAEADRAEPLLRGDAVGDVAERAGDPRPPPPAAARGRPAQHGAVRTVFV